jgi:hypothetical protein
MWEILPLVDKIFMCIAGAIIVFIIVVETTGFGKPR